ncbi:MAG: hypothetical protein HOP34_17350 [Methylococcaceae bacterium]|nr:hypothetical protein [Methylococcaceae bacterium]
MLKKIDLSFVIAAYVYLATPVLLFIGGWVKWPLSIPLILIILVAVVRGIKQFGGYRELVMTQKLAIKAALIGVVLAIWVAYSGIGGFSFQNQDFQFRNAVFHDLIDFDWPLIYTYYDIPNQPKGALVYYLAYWLPAALFGKFFGFDAANVFLYAWTVLGISLFFYFVSRYINAVSFVTLLLLIFWSGLDFIGEVTEYNPVFIGQHIEWWAMMYQYSSNTTALYWVFNQVLAPWLILAFILNDRNAKSIVFVYSLCFLSAPFSCVGLAPFVAVRVLFLNGFGLHNLKAMLSFQNCVAAPLIMAVSIAYYLSNSKTIGSLGGQAYDTVFNNLNVYCKFIVLEFLVYFMLLFTVHKKNPLYYTVLGVLLLLPFYKIGVGNDFVMRVSLPALMMLMILVVQFFLSKNNPHSLLKSVLLMFLLIGAITPINEMYRSVTNTALYDKEHYIKDKLKTLSVFKREYEAYNIPNVPYVAYVSLGYKQSFFFRYLSP